MPSLNASNFTAGLSFPTHFLPPRTRNGTLHLSIDLSGTCRRRNPFPVRMFVPLMERLRTSPRLPRSLTPTFFLLPRAVELLIASKPRHVNTAVE